MDVDECQSQRHSTINVTIWCQSSLSFQLMESQIAKWTSRISKWISVPGTFTIDISVHWRTLLGMYVILHRHSQWRISWKFAMDQIDWLKFRWIPTEFGQCFQGRSIDEWTEKDFIARNHVLSNVYELRANCFSGRWIFIPDFVDEFRIQRST